MTLSRADAFRPPEKKPHLPGRPLQGPPETFHRQEEAEVTTGRRRRPGLAVRRISQGGTAVAILRLEVSN